MSARITNEIKLCPNCGNSDINYASLESRSGAIVGIGIPEQYYCPRCEYFGSVVVEVPRSQLKKIKFYPKKRIVSLSSEKSSSILEPVFVTTLLLFFVVVLFFAIPTYDIFKAETPGTVDLTNIASTQNNINVNPTRFETNITVAEPLGITYLVARNTSLIDIDRALGLQNVGGFLVPLFFLFFFTGILFLLVYSHWRRVRFFS